MTKRYITSITIWLIATLATVAVPYCDIRKFSITDGLAANSISDMKQANDKLMWFSTWNGLSFYDGYAFHTFRDEPDQTDVLSTNRIMNIEPTANNNIWCITSDRQLYLYDTHLCNFIQKGREYNEMFGIDLRVQNIYPIKKGNTWITSSNADYLIRTNSTDDSSAKPELIRVGQQGLRSGKVWFIYADPKGREWILTAKGTTIYNHHFSTPIPFKWIRVVGESVFLATSDGKLAVYDEQNKLTMIPLPKGVTKINQLKNTGYQLLIATNLGLVIYNPRTFKSEVINVQSPSQPMAEVKNIYTDDYDMVWVFTEGMGVTLVNPKTGYKQWLYADQENSIDRTESDKYFITQDENKTLWVVPNKGTFSYFDRKNGKLVPYLLRSNSSGNYRIPKISKFTLSDQGILWITGIHDLTQIAFKEHYYKLNGIAMGESEVRALCNSPEGYHWNGYINGMLQLIDNQYNTVGYMSPSGQVVPNQVALSDKGIYALFYDAAGRLWIGTKGDGIYIKTPNGGLAHYLNVPTDRFSLPSNNVFDIVSDRKGNIWVATYGGGLALVKNNADGSINFISKNNGLQWPKVNFSKTRRITCTPTGEILVGTTDGLITFSDNFQRTNQIKFHTTTYHPDDTLSLAANDVNFIMQHSNGNIYISELGGSLEQILNHNLLTNNLKTEYFKMITPNEGIIQSMLEDNDGNLWIVRESSIDKCDLKRKTTTVFGPNDFDYNMSFSEARPIHDPATNNITLGTPMGSLTFNPRTLKKSQYQPHVIFTQLHYNGENESQPILHTEKLVIPANKRNLTISFAALDYSRKYQNKYRYRLEGFTPPGVWISNGSRNVIGFNRIAHGDYVLKVSATNSHGVWSKYVAELPIEVRPTFWESIWGKLTLLLLLLGIVGSLFHSYNLRQRQKLSHEMSEMKNEFFSEASHKLRTPLTLIGGPVVEVLKTEPNLSERSRDMLETVQKNALEMLHMLDKVLRFDNNSNFYTDGGINENTPVDEENLGTDQIDDKNANKYLAESNAEREAELQRKIDNGEDTTPTRKEITLLVVEDNNDLRKFLYNILEGSYNVLLAENGKAGLLAARKYMPDFILTDVTMPVMDGITMIRQIKQDSTISHIPIIILSAKASVEDQTKGFEQGIDGYLTKPFSSAYLISRIEAVINQRRAIQQEVIRKLKDAGDQNAIAAYHLLPSAPANNYRQPTSAEDQAKDENSEFEFMSSQINDKTTTKIMKYVNDNMSNPDLKIDDIAQAMGMSRSVLYGRIKTAVGMTPIDFVRHIRIMKACELLQHTDDTLTSIAYNIGFSDPKYFSKVFKKEMGIIPSEYRERTQRD